MLNPKPEIQKTIPADVAVNTLSIEVGKFMAGCIEIAPQITGGVRGDISGVLRKGRARPFRRVLERLACLPLGARNGGREFGVVVGKTETGLQGGCGLEVHFEFRTLAGCSAEVTGKDEAAGWQRNGLLNIGPVDVVHRAVNGESMVNPLGFRAELVIPDRIGLKGGGRCR